jgi:hypothetical protein
MGRSPAQVFWDAVIAHREGGSRYRLGLDEQHEPVYMSRGDRARGLYIIGHPGQGKTTLVQHLILQDMAAGNGLIFLTTEEETFTERILPFVPESRIRDVVYLNPRDTERPIAFNPLHVNPGESFEQKRSQTTTILRRIFAEASSGPAPRADMILSHAVSTLMQIPGSTLEDVAKLINPYEPSFRHWAVTQIADEGDQAFWSDPSLYARFPKDAHLPLTVRLDPLLHSSSVRALLCTPRHSFNLRQSMDAGKIVLVNLADGILGAHEASIIGQLIVSQLQLATMSRADQPEHQRRPFYAYLDEFQKFCNTDSVSYLEMLARGRRYRVPMILAHQETGQIPDAIMRGIFGTVSTIAAFTVSYSDANKLGREMRLEEPFVLQDQPVGHCHCRLDRRAFRLATDPPPQGGKAEHAAEVIRHSRETYGARAERAVRIAYVPTAAVPPAPAKPAPTVPPARRATPPIPPPPVPAAAPAGRGGTRHKYLQGMIAKWAESNDWRAVVEERVLDGLGSVDVALRKGDRAVACEICVTTESDHELENIQKCLTAGFEQVFAISEEQKVRNRLKALLTASLEESQTERVVCCSPEELFEHLDALQATPDGEKTVRGYKVRVRRKAGGAAEKKRKVNIVSEIIAKAFKRRPRS